MKYHALFVIFEKAEKFEIVVCCKLYVALYGLTIIPSYHRHEKYLKSSKKSLLGHEKHLHG